MNIKWLFYLFCVFGIESNAQISDFRYYVDTLSSPYFSGRGYVEEGHLKAAKFLAEEFNEIGLKSIEKNNYLQEFPIDVNTFPYEINLSCSGQELIPGIDYLIEPSSGSLSGNFKIIPITFDNLLNAISDFKENNSSSILLINASKVDNKDTLSLYNELKMELSNIGPVIWLINSKLTWSVSDYELKYPVIQILSSVMDDNCKNIEVNIENVMRNSLMTNNVIGKIEGRKKKTLVLTAHYDHLGMMGSTLFPGANDNASGVSLLLNLAKYYTTIKCKYNMVFICFGAEETGLKGSKYFIEHPLIDLEKIKFLLNLDIVGTGGDGIALVNAKDQQKIQRKIIKINSKNGGFDKVKIRGQAPNSDHYWFSQKGVSALFLYTLGGISAYHDPMDISSTLPLTKMDQLFDLIVKVLDEI